MPRKGTTRPPRLSRRTRIVWGSFLGSMAMVTGLLALSDHRAVRGFPAAKTSLFADSVVSDPIFRTTQPLDRSRWKGIIIHHSGEPAGNAQSMQRLHLGYGYRSMGYHFLVGNGNGMGDGVVHVGERWIEQASGWHAVGPDAAFHNRHAVAICLMGNGDRRRFTDRQMAQLISLVRRLQRRLNIPPSAVRLHRDVAPGLTNSPGARFPVADLEQQLLNPLR